MSLLFERELRVIAQVGERMIAVLSGGRLVAVLQYLILGDYMFWNFLVFCIALSALQQLIVFMAITFKVAVIALLIVILLCVWLKR